MLPLPAEVYLSDASYAADQKLIAAHWTCIGRVEDVPLPGSFIRGPGRLIVVRGEDLELRAMFDVCRHRAATILDGEAGRVARLVCPYHGWSYDLSGRGKECDGLVRAHVATWGGFVFVSRVGGPLPAPEFVTADLARLRAGHRARWEVLANWKLLVENFQESHHFPRVHPGLERHTPFARSSSIVGDGPWLGGRMELVSETVSLDGQRHGRPLIAEPGVVLDALLFPTSLFSVQPDYVLSYRLAPLAPDRTRVDFTILFHPAVAHLEHPDVIDFWRQTNDEDRAICERQMEGLREGVWTPLCYAESEDGMIAFDRLIRRAYS